MRSLRFVVLASCAVALVACTQPMLTSQSTLLPITAAGHGAHDHGIAGIDAQAVVRAADVRAGGEPTPSTMYVPRLQLDFALWARVGRYVTLALTWLVGLGNDAFGVTASPLPPPNGAPWALGGVVAGRLPIDDENRVDLDLNVLVGAAPSNTTYVDVSPCGYGCTPMTSAPYSKVEGLTAVVAAGHARWVHRFGPVSTILLVGLGTQPVNGALGGESASMGLSLVAMAGGGIRVDLTDWLGVQLLLVAPFEAARFQVGPLISLGVTLGGGQHAGETAPPTVIR